MGMEGGGLEGAEFASELRGEPGKLLWIVCEGPIVNGVIIRSFCPACGVPKGPAGLPLSRSRSRWWSLGSGGGGSSFPGPCQNADMWGDPTCCFGVDADSSITSVGAPERARRCSKSRTWCGLRDWPGVPALALEPDGSPVMGGGCALLPGPLNP